MIETLKLFLVLYLFFVLLLYVGQRKLMYLPTPVSNYAEEARITFQVNEQSLTAWQLNPGKSQALMYFGGNAESVEANIDDFKEIFPSYTLYLIAYRGYGGSTGEPTEEGLKADALAIYEQLASEHRYISVMGRSLGSGVAVHLAAKRKIHKMILVTPFDSVLNVAKGIYWMFPLSVLLKDKFESWKEAKDVGAETLMLIAERDEVIPARRGKKLAEYFIHAVPEVKVIRHASHNNIEQFEQYKQALVDFVR